MRIDKVKPVGVGCKLGWMAGHGYHIDNIDPFFRLFIHSLVTDMIRAGGLPKNRDVVEPETI